MTMVESDARIGKFVCFYEIINEAIERMTIFGIIIIHFQYEGSIVQYLGLAFSIFVIDNSNLHLCIYIAC